ncbi:MAG: AI-2E family transporter [Treponema sp.]|nr:AI-2E family transporter [Treponema sp.]
MKDRFQTFNSGRVMFFLLAVIALILFAAVLRITASIVVPFTIAFLLALVTSPIVKLLAKFRIPRIVSIFIVVILIIGTLFVVGMILYNSGRTLLNLYPRYEARLTEIYVYVALFFELPYDEYLSFFDNIWGQVGIRDRVRLMTLSFTNGFLSFLSDAFLVVLFLVFFLLEAAFFRDKLNAAFEGPRATRIKKLSSDIMTQISRYLSMKFIISLVTGIVVTIGLRIIGVELAVIWGIIQFVLNFIPNIGSIAAGVGATAFALVQFFPAPGPIVATGIIMLGANMIIGNFIEPKVMGDRLGLSPLAVLISLMVWGYLWGFAGMILAVPMMAITKIVCESFSVLEPISILLGSRKAAVARSMENQEGVTTDNAADTSAGTPTNP